MTSGHFLQSNEWQKFQESLGRKTWRVDPVRGDIISNASNGVDGAFVVKMDFILGLYFLYSPKGPLFEINNDFLKKINEIAKKEKAFFYRIEPPAAPPKTFERFRDKEPKCTLITDISKPENMLLAEMHKKTRYNIRLAERKGIKISTPPFLPLRAGNMANIHYLTEPEALVKGRSEEGFKQFYKLLELTARRQKIKLHSKEYYKKLVNCSDNNLRGRASYCNEIFIAYHENVPVACAMINLYKDTATYLHGGSDEKYKNLMAPNLLHWEIIKTAKSRGAKFYDWWGIDEKKWPGITRFKRGFGGKELCAPGTFDLPINKFLYRLYGFFRK